MKSQSWFKKLERYLVTGIFVLVPAWGTLLILYALFNTLDGLWVDLLSAIFDVQIPGAGITSLLIIILLGGMLATHFVGQRLLSTLEESLARVPVVRSIYNTLKGMADVFQFRERFGQSTVVVFPFPREGLWALGFVMGIAPPVLQVGSDGPLLLVFVPTAIHPFTGYLAFVPETKARRVNLRPQEAMKLEFSAGLYRPPRGWLAKGKGPSLTSADS